MKTPWTPETASSELLAVVPFLNRLIAKELRAEMEDETTICQIRILGQLLDGPLTLSVLAKKRQVSLQAASVQVQAIVERGWVVREPDATDRRQSMLVITEAGRAYHQQARQRVVQALAPLLEGLTSAEMAAVQVAIPALHRVLDRETLGLEVAHAAQNS